MIDFVDFVCIYFVGSGTGDQNDEKKTWKNLIIFVYLFGASSKDFNKCFNSQSTKISLCSLRFQSNYQILTPEN